MGEHGRKRIHRIYPIYLTAFLVLGGLAVRAEACPICKDAWSSTTEGLGFAKGVYYSVLLMLGMFFGIVAILVAYIVKQARKTPKSWQGKVPGAEAARP